MKKVKRLLIILHAIVGIGALAGGYAAFSVPDGPFGIPVEILRNSPFNNFFIPGVILFIVIGLGNLISALMFYIKTDLNLYISFIFSCALMVFIIVQCIMLLDVNFLHIIFFIVGLIQASLSIIIMFYKKMFPTNIILNFYNEKIKKSQNRA